MKTEIINLIDENGNQNFIFNKSPSDSSALNELRSTTKNVPEEDGIYFVFTPLNENRLVEDHLIYTINDRYYEFIYFGIAGGVTADGKEGDQKLRKRINNVVGSNSISRAIKWNEALNENNLPSFTVFYCLLNQPKNIEDKIYSYLKEGKLKYPLLNKKRGRPSK
jgi:hypothetical protein